MFPNAVIDDFLFEPCGYSMNALQEAGLMTIHVTPEAHCSYASVRSSARARRRRPSPSLRVPIAALPADAQHRRAPHRRRISVVTAEDCFLALPL